MELPVLNRRFRGPGDFTARGAAAATPIRFDRLDHTRYVATNIAGQYCILDRPTLIDLAQGALAADHPRYRELVAKHFVTDQTTDVGLDLLAAKFFTRHATLSHFTSLHLFVVTLRCDHSCPYCQVSRVSDDKTAFDMSPESASRAIDLAFASPSPVLKIEFQGGESLLNFERIAQIVTDIKARPDYGSRTVQFVVATNLSPLTNEMLAFFKEHGVFISTSLDGPRGLHNANRPRRGGDSYERAVAGIRRCREALGDDSVHALMTTTRRSLLCAEAIVDEYVSRGFPSIFLRWLSPYGFAARSSASLGYDANEWLAFYERGLRHAIRLSREGRFIREDLASIILSKMLRPVAGGYVDLQSPMGLGIGVAVYNYDGDVYASDEGRMLAETGDTTFRLGNVHRDSYEQIFLSPRLQQWVFETMTEATPGCSDCPYQPYCGADPVFHHAVQGDIVGHRPASAFCRRNMGVFKLLIRMLEDEPESREVLESWV